MMAGREFTVADNMNAPKVAIVNQQFVKRFWMAGIPWASSSHQWRRSRYRDRGSSEGRPLFRREAGSAEAVLHAVAAGQAAQPAQFLCPLGAACRPDVSADPARHAGDRSRPAGAEPATFEATIQNNIQSDRLVFKLAAAFAVLATALAMLGLYGVMATA